MGLHFSVDQKMKKKKTIHLAGDISHQHRRFNSAIEEMNEKKIPYPEETREDIEARNAGIRK